MEEFSRTRDRPLIPLIRLIGAAAVGITGVKLNNANAECVKQRPTLFPVMRRV
jgi:hypothetical protein